MAIFTLAICEASLSSRSFITQLAFDLKIH